MVLEVFTGTLERLACQFHRLFKDIKRYAVLEAVNSVHTVAKLNLAGHKSKKSKSLD